MALPARVEQLKQKIREDALAREMRKGAGGGASDVSNWRPSGAAQPGPSNGFTSGAPVPLSSQPLTHLASPPPSHPQPPTASSTHSHPTQQSAAASYAPQPAHTAQLPHTGNTAQAGHAPAQAGHAVQRGAGADPAELDALRQQVEAFRSITRQAEAASAAAANARDAAASEAQKLRAEHEGATRKIAVLKGQLMKGQAEAEEAAAEGVREVQEAADAARAEEVGHWREQNQQLTERIARLESRLEAANGKAAERGATTEQVAALQGQLKTAATQLAEMQGALAAGKQRAQADAAALAARDSELANMHLAMGELTYEAQAASSSQLQVHRLQGEVRIAADAAAAARAEGAALRERAESAAASAAAAHTRCEGAEQRAVGLLDEVLRARATVAEHSARVRALEAAAMSCVDKRQVADVLVGLLTRTMPRDAALQQLADLLVLTPEECVRLGLRTDGASGQARPRTGILSRIVALPGRILTAGPPQNKGAASRPTIANDWVDFLMERTDSATALRLPPSHNPQSQPPADSNAQVPVAPSCKATPAVSFQAPSTTAEVEPPTPGTSAPAHGGPAWGITGQQGPPLPQSGVYGAGLGRPPRSTPPRGTANGSRAIYSGPQTMPAGAHGDGVPAHAAASPETRRIPLRVPPSQAGGLADPVGQRSYVSSLSEPGPMSSRGVAGEPGRNTGLSTAPAATAASTWLK